MSAARGRHWNSRVPETLNRCRPVTDKRKSAWQKRNPLQRMPFEVSLSSGALRRTGRMN
jgi:hypothetical protein